MTRRLLFDVTGLIHWYAFHAHPSGIQRVTEKLIRSAPVRQSNEVEFVARALGGDTFYRVASGALGDPLRLRALFARSLGAARLGPLMNDLRWFHLPYLPLGLLAAVLPSLQPAPPPGPQDTLFNPGDLWWQRQFAPFTLDLKARTGVRVVQMIHDLFVFDRPDWFDPRFARDFTSVFQQLAPGVDRWLTNSSYVKGELTAWLAGRALPARPVEVLPMGWDSFEAPQGDQDATLQRYGIDGPFILFVGTVEPRKNLAALLDAMAALRRDLGAGVPKLVVVGGYGWQAASVAARLRRDPSVVWLRFVRDATCPSFIAGRASLWRRASPKDGVCRCRRALPMACPASPHRAARCARRATASQSTSIRPTPRACSRRRPPGSPTMLHSERRARIAAALRGGTFATWDDAGRTLLEQAK